MTRTPMHNPATRRKAFAARGDDTTLTRFVKIPHEPKPRRHQPRIPGLSAEYIESGRSKFWRGGLKAPNDVGSLLVSGHNNMKIGRDVRKGKLRGYWIYTLTLEERATCPATCHHWQTCYGNNMPYAKRIKHGAAMLEKLEAEIETLLAVKGRTGVLLRLHALGDFYSESYVGFWRTMLLKHDRLAIFGYTAWPPTSPIGQAVTLMNAMAPDRCFVRFSNGGLGENCTVPVYTADAVPPGAFLCPEQSGKTQCCATCGACWGTRRNVAFLEH